MGEFEKKDNDNIEQNVVEDQNDSKLVLGKFKNANALLDAYNSLEAEFTRRSQKLKELEGLVGNKENSNFQSIVEKIPQLKEYQKDGTVEGCISSLVEEINSLQKIAEKSSNEEDTEVYEKATKRSGVKDRIISDYLLSLNSMKTVPLLDSNGSAIYLPENKPRTINEAGLMAEKLFKRE